jgi:quercetin dioxygenase-like cupin family protein
VLGTFDLAAEIARFQPGDGASGRRAEHTAPGPITIQPLRGRFVVSAAAREDELGEGQLIALAAGVHHAVRAIEGGAFLLTIGWPADEHGSLPDDVPAPASPPR